MQGAQEEQASAQFEAGAEEQQASAEAGEGAEPQQATQPPQAAQVGPDEATQPPLAAQFGPDVATPERRDAARKWDIIIKKWDPTAMKEVCQENGV